MPNLTPSKELFEKARAAYKKEATSSQFSALITGEWGVGKTSLAFTGRRPYRVYAFDTSYESLPVVRKGIEEGWVLLCLLNKEDSNKPTEWEKFSKQVTEDLKSGILNACGSIVWDSLTLSVEYAANKLRKFPLMDKNYERPPGTLIQADYQTLYEWIRTKIRILQSTNADLIVPCHTHTLKNALTGGIETELALYKGLRTIVPALFSERYALTKQAKGSKVEYKLVTNNQDRLKAATRIGSGIFSIEEEPNLKALLKKAGRDYKDLEY